jgi:hypothetical protein
MPLVSCRACEHQVDISALACPNCGATDPGRKISRQQRDARNFVIQVIVWTGILAFAAWFVLSTVIPWARPYIVRQQAEQSER